MSDSLGNQSGPAAVGSLSLSSPTPISGSGPPPLEGRKRKHKPISFQKMAMIQEELSKIEMHLEALYLKESSIIPEAAAEEEEAEEVDPALVHMVVVELCQLCASGDTVGVRILLHGGANPSSRDYDERPLLHIAAMNDRLPVVNVLLEFGADFTAKDRDGATALDVALDHGFMDIAQLLSGLLETNEVMPDSFAGHPGSCSSSPNSQHAPDFSAVPQPMVGSLIIIMVGLPGRGKSYVAQQIRRYFQWNGLASNIFSHQQYKRRAERQRTSADLNMTMTSYPADLENRVTLEIAKDLTKFVSRTGGVAILDGTHTTHARRQAILRAIKETQRIKQNRVIFVEIINNDKDAIRRNILHAQEVFPNPPDDFVEQYYAVMAQHEAVYKSLSAVADCDLSFIKIEDNTSYALNMISGWMPSRLAYMLHNLSHSPQNLYLTRAGEYVDMVAGRLGGNSRLTERGRAYSVVLFNFFKREVPSPRPLTVMTSCSKRCIQTVHHFAEESIKQVGVSPVAAEPSLETELNCRVSYFPTLDDINHGDCEGQLLADVKKTMPSTLEAMRADPYYTAWPNGECIHQVFNARLEPHIHDIQASTSPVLVVSHLNLLQGLHSYFVSQEDSAVDPQNAYEIDIPLEAVIRIKMVGLTRVAEVIDLAAEVDRVMWETTGTTSACGKPDAVYNMRKSRESAK